MKAAVRSPRGGRNPAGSKRLSSSYLRAMTKEKLFEAVKDLPENFELEDLFERLLFIKRVEEGIRQSDAGETLTEAEARSYLSRWLTDAGAAAR